MEGGGGGRPCHRCGSCADLTNRSLGSGDLTNRGIGNGGGGGGGGSLTNCDTTGGHKRAMSYQYSSESNKCINCEGSNTSIAAGNLGLDFPSGFYHPESHLGHFSPAERPGGDSGGGGGGGMSNGYSPVPVSLPEAPPDVVVEVKTKVVSSKTMRNEMKKTFLAFIFQQVTQVIMIWTVVKSNDRMDLESPVLPDIVLDRVPVVKWAGQWSEILLFSLFVMFGVVGLFHQHRFLILRRILAVTGICLIIRSFCVWATVLPRSLSSMECAPKSRNTGEVLHRVLIMYVTSGLSIFGGHMCGNYFFSGHTCLMTVIHCAFHQYTPNSLRPVKRLVTLQCVAIAVLILLAHNHYTLDVLGAYYVASRVWMFYHFLAHNPQHRLNSGLSLCWTWLVNIFEDGSDGPVDNKLQSVSEIYALLFSRGSGGGTEWKPRVQVF